MAKARKRRAAGKAKKKAKTARRAPAKRRTAKKARAPVRKKKTARRARREQKAGVVDRVKGAVETIVEVAQETQAMREKMGTRGGLSDG